MPDQLEICCPCCETRMVVDVATGEILSAERPKQAGKSFEDALGEVRTGAKRREDAFSKAFDRTRNLDTLLEKKFKEARKKAKDGPEKPLNPLDLD